MVTVTLLVKKHIEANPYLQEALALGIISHPGLADYLQPALEKELGKEIKLPAIVMALRRLSEEIKQKTIHKTFLLTSEKILKTNLVDLGYRKSSTLTKKLPSLYNLIHTEKGEVLNIIQGNNEVSIITNKKHGEAVKKMLKGEGLLTEKEELVSISFSFSDKFLTTPGVIYNILRKLSWNKINIYEIISTNTELHIIIDSKEVPRAFVLLEELEK